MSFSTRALEAWLTRVGGGVLGSDCEARAALRAFMKAGAISAWTRIRSVAMQIWPDCFIDCD